MTAPARLILIPGIGADARLFHRQLAAFPDALVPPWPAPESTREPLAHYAARLAAALPGDRPLVIAGISLGGMLALEAAAAALAAGRDVRGAALIASCRHPSAVTPILRLVERLARPIPDAVINLGRPIGAPLLGRGGRPPLSKEDRRVLAQMARDIDVRHLRWAARAIMDWPGRPDPGVPVRHIHGGRDWVILPKRAAPTEILPGGAHVLNMSHGAEVNRFLSDCIDLWSRKAGPQMTQTNPD